MRLKFSDEALEAIAELAMERKVGARGLRMILEELMLDLMYYLPSYKKVREFQVTKEMVLTQKISLDTAGKGRLDAGVCPPSCRRSELRTADRADACLGQNTCLLQKKNPIQDDCR